MAKYCGRCGAKLSGNEKICNQCGMKIEEILLDDCGIGKSNSEINNKDKKKMKAFTFFTIVAIIAIIIFNIASGFMGIKGQLRKIMTAYEKYDIDMMVSLSSDVYYYGEDDYVDEYFKNSVGEDLDLIEETVGHSYKLSYKVNEIYSMSERRKDEILDNIESMYSKFDITIIKDLAEADVTVEAKQGSKSKEIDLKITMSKENNIWKLLYIE